MKHRFSRRERCASCSEKFRMGTSVERLRNFTLQGSDIMSPVQQKKIEDIWSSPQRRTRDLKRTAKSTDTPEPKPENTPKSKT